jgi:hypothetical protein
MIETCPKCGKPTAAAKAAARRAYLAFALKVWAAKLDPAAIDANLAERSQLLAAAGVTAEECCEFIQQLPILVALGDALARHAAAPTAETAAAAVECLELVPCEG